MRENGSIRMVALVRGIRGELRRNPYEEVEAEVEAIPQ